MDIHANRNHVRIQIGVAAQSGSDKRQLTGANTGEGQRHEKHHRVFLTVLELNVTSERPKSSFSPGPLLVLSVKFGA